MSRRRRRTRTAYHEAGHAIAALAQGGVVSAVSIQRDSDRGTRDQTEATVRDDARPLVALAVALHTGAPQRIQDDGDPGCDGQALAAGGRGDDAERERLLAAAVRKMCTIPDHYAFATAFDEVSLLVFVELLDGAACFLEWLDRADAFDPLDDEAEREGGETDPEANGDRSEKPARQRSLDLALAAGHILKAKFPGWQKFCRGWGAEPFVLWEGLPGMDRLRRALDLAERAAFTPEGFLQWANSVRPEGEPERAAVALTAEGAAAMFAARVEWWGG
jgi:alkylhydroperoxidase family enzyme